MKLDTYRLDNGQYPASLTELTLVGQSGLGPYARSRDFSDPWGNAFYYRAKPNGASFALFTLGRDAQIGGRGVDRDIQAEPVADES